MNDSNIDMEEKTFFCEKNDFVNNCCEINYRACELCKTARCSLDINNNLSRLLRVKVNLKNCCIGKEISVACLIFDNCNNILAYKTRTFIVDNNNHVLLKEAQLQNKNDYSSNCCRKNCIDVDKLFTFVLPANDICSPLTVRAKVIANYTNIQCN